MGVKLQIKKITRDDFFKIKEDDLMFITNPGRMGDEDGSTFIVKNGNEYNAYRIDGWMYGNVHEENNITYDEARKQFPKWNKLLKRRNNKCIFSKYVYLYMGFGNGLSVDKRIYKEYEPFLIAEAKKIGEIEADKAEDISQYYYHAWFPAVEEMLNSKQIM